MSTTLQQIQEAFDQIQRSKEKSNESLKQALVKFFAGKGALSISSEIIERGLPEVIYVNDESVSELKGFDIKFIHTTVLNKGQYYIGWKKDNSRQLGLPIWQEIEETQRNLNKLIFQNRSQIAYDPKSIGGISGFGTDLIFF